MSNQFTKVESPFPGDWQPAYVSLGLERVLRDVEAITGESIFIGQPPYNTRNKASAGTHDKRNCADLYGSRRELDLEMKWLRLLGWPGHVRTPAQGNWPLHLHFWKHGDSGIAWLAGIQDDAYVLGFDGLGKNGRAGRDKFWRPADPRIEYVYKDRQRFTVRVATHGYEQPTKRLEFQKKRREPGFAINNHIATVKDGKGKQFIVTKNGTFYDRQKLKAVA